MRGSTVSSLHLVLAGFARPRQRNDQPTGGSLYVILAREWNAPPGGSSSVRTLSVGMNFDLGLLTIFALCARNCLQDGREPLVGEACGDGPQRNSSGLFGVLGTQVSFLFFLLESKVIPVPPGACDRSSLSLSLSLALSFTPFNSVLFFV